MLNIRIIHSLQLPPTVLLDASQGMQQQSRWHFSGIHNHKLKHFIDSHQGCKVRWSFKCRRERCLENKSASEPTFQINRQNRGKESLWKITLDFVNVYQNIEVKTVHILLLSQGSRIIFKSDLENMI